MPSSPLLSSLQLVPLFEDIGPPDDDSGRVERRGEKAEGEGDALMENGHFFFFWKAPPRPTSSFSLLIKRIWEMERLFMSENCLTLEGARERAELQSTQNLLFFPSSSVHLSSYLIITISFCPHLEKSSVSQDSLISNCQTRKRRRRGFFYTLPPLLVCK